MQEMSKGTACTAALLSPFIEAAFFCLYWNVFKVYEAVGHGLGTVGYLTALGVDLAASSVLLALAGACYGGVHSCRRIYDGIYG